MRSPPREAAYKVDLLLTKMLIKSNIRAEEAYKVDLLLTRMLIKSNIIELLKYNDPQFREINL